MSITIHDVQNMAKLARLELSPETEELFAKQFVDIINHMQILVEVDTKGIEPMYSPSMQNTPLRNDEAFPRVERHELLQNAPKSDGQYFVVPRIV